MEVPDRAHAVMDRSQLQSKRKGPECRGLVVRARYRERRHRPADAEDDTTVEYARNFGVGLKADRSQVFNLIRTSDIGGYPVPGGAEVRGHRRAHAKLENVELLLEFVARGFGIAAIPQSMVEGRRLSHLAIVPKRKSHVLPHWEIGMFRAKTQSQLSPNPPAETFRTTIFEAFGGKGRRP